MSDLDTALAAHGWAVVTGPGDAVSTAGLTAEGLPELAVVGLPADVGGALLHEVAERLLAGVPVDSPDELLADLVDDGPPLALRPVEPPGGLPAADLAPGPVALLQLVWADAAGRFPGDDGFAHDDVQPLLGPPPHAPLPDGWTLPGDPCLPVRTARTVVDGERPALLVVRDDEGEVLFVMDGVSDFVAATARDECLHDAVARDPSLAGAVRDLPPGHAAERDTAGGSWRTGPW